MRKNRPEFFFGGETIPIAIIGLAFEFPQDATSEGTFWEMLCNGSSASTDFPRDRLNIDGFYHPEEGRPSSISVRAGNFVKEDLGAFDAPFFKISPREAECMDPQHRRMLEVAYHAFEDAGIPSDQYSGSKTSVYTGCFTNDYLSILQQDYDAEQNHAAVGIAPSMLANRLSWFFNLKGPSVNLDSACSSSLLALHLACQDLRTGTSSMALVGGANLVYHPNFMKMMSDFNFLSPDGQCWSFDERANGYARGEGTAIMIIKRLGDALQDGNTIRAVIRNTGSNQDGRTSRITQPSQNAQVELIDQVFTQAKLSKEHTRYFECHGTGTPVGDPIEANAVGMAFRDFRTPDDPLYIGAVKANIGHLEGCSGLAGVIKTVLVLERGIIPPIAGLTRLNNQINSKELRLHFPNEVIPWPESELRRACVNSFGFGGTNVIAIIDDACHYLNLNSLHGYHRTEATTGRIHHLTSVDNNRNNLSSNFGLTRTSSGFDDIVMPEDPKFRLPKLLIWSASDRVAVESLNDAYRRYIIEHQLSLDNLAYTLVARKNHFPWRGFAIAGHRSDTSHKDTETTQSAEASANVQVAYVFTGQGAQYLGMGRGLVAYTKFQESLNRSEECLKSLGCEWSLHDIINGNSPDLKIDDPKYSQPLTTCLQIALVDLLKSFGVVSSVVIGHSSGEIAAAYTAGALPQPTAIRIAYHRGVLSSFAAKKSKGLSMMVVGLSRDKTVQYLERLTKLDGLSQVTIGCVNSPRNVTLTGDVAQLKSLEQWFKDDSVFSRWLRVPVAYHSPFMESIANDYLQAIGKMDYDHDISRIPMISSVTQDIITGEALIEAGYWVRNLTSTVEFQGAFSKLVAEANKEPRKKLGKCNDLHISHVLEIGPHSALQGPVREILESFPTSKKPIYVPSLIRRQDAPSTLLTALGTLYCAGYPVDIHRANQLDGSARPMPPDLPLYPFNHQHTYWRESRLSTNFRFRSQARHDLLGTPSVDWNSHIAQWRNIMRLSELPWLEDHKINGEIIFPAAGVVCMVIEGLRQLIDHSSSLLGIQIRNINFLRPIRVSEVTRTVETQLTISTDSSSSAFTKWTHFRLFLLENGMYMECSNGFIRAVTDLQDQTCIARAAPSLDGVDFQQWMDSLSKACQAQENDPYDMHTNTNVQYGSSFMNVENMRLSPHGEAIAQINTESWKLGAITKLAPSFAIHPTTLDGMAQLLLPALAHQHGDLPTMVPVRIAAIWIVCKNGACDYTGILAGAKTSLRGFHGASADIAATTLDRSRPLVYLKGLETAFIESLQSRDIRSSQPRLLCTKLFWKPDVELMTSEQLLFYCTSNRPPQPPGTVQKYKHITTVSMYFIQDALRALNERQGRLLKPHFQAYVEWMSYQQQRLRQGESPVSSDSVRELFKDSNYRDHIFGELDRNGADGHFFMEIGRSLIKVLVGEMDALDMMFKDGLVDRYYEFLLADEHHVYPASVYIDLLSFKNPSMKILEVGAGTGGQTLPLLEKLSSDDVKKWARYDYTDISPSFFNPAQTKLQRFADRIDFRVLDISKDPLSQGFDEGSYDLVIASHVLHATNDLDQSLRNVRKLLKRDGKLLLFETTQPDAVHIGFAFGLLKGWWDPLNHEIRSPYSPCISLNQWHERLAKTGFSGIDVSIPGQADPQCQYSSMMISTAIECDRDNGSSSRFALVICEHIRDQIEVASKLQSHLSGRLGSCEILTLSELTKAEPFDFSATIFLVECNALFLDGMSEVDYGQLNFVLTRSNPILWITKSQTGFPDPRHSLADGLGRVLMSEDSTRKFTTLSLTGLELTYQALSKVVDVVERIIGCSVELSENNYIAHGNTFHIGRISTNVTMNEAVQKATLPYCKKNIQLGALIPTSIHLASRGYLETPEWVEYDGASDTAPLGQDEVVVEVRAIGLTLRDHLTVTRQLDDHNLGTEGAGVVQAAGPRSGLQRGDRVCLISPSAISSITRLKADAVSVIPENMTFSEAASIPFAAWLSHHTLVNVAHLERGETALIYETPIPVCQIMVHVARLLGVNVIVATSSTSTFDFLRRELEIPEKDIIQGPVASFPDQIRKVTHGEGVDAIVGPLQHDAEVDLVECLAPFGRLIDTALTNRRSGVNVPKSVPMNISRTSVNFIDLFKRKPSLVYGTFQRATKMIFNEHLKPPRPARVFQAGDIKAAFDHLETEPVGHITVELDPGTVVSAEMKTTPKSNFPADATYVIAGGLGGLGRSFARWMAARGARNLILFSRSGVKSAAARRLVDELQMQGVRVATPTLDISEIGALQRALGELEGSMPPVRGCIQATVALRDNLFENMTYEDWVVSTRSKVTGSWNLHEALPSDMDFFILMSSVNGIFGGRAQANYAAGNTFKDALAHYRISLGQKAVSIGLGLMVSEGVVAENASLLTSMRRIGHLMDIRQEELIALLDYYCDASLPILTHAEAQVLVGIEMPSAVLAKGIDLHHSIRRPMFSHLFQVGPKENATAQSGATGIAVDGGIDKQSALKRAASHDDAVVLVTKWLSDKIRQVLGLKESQIDPNKPLHTYGMDSLVAIDLKNWLSAEIGAQIEVFVLLGNLPLKEISAEAVRNSRYLGGQK